MRVATTSTVLSAIFFTLIAGIPTHAFPAKDQSLKPRSGLSIISNPKGQSGLPSLPQPRPFGGESLRLDNIQSEVLIGMKKKKQILFFLQITDPTDFKRKLSKEIRPRITSVAQILDDQKQPVTTVNIAFSKAGLSALGVSENLGDDAFSSGQAADALALGDPGTRNWVPAFDGTQIHCVLLLASDTSENTNRELDAIRSILGNSIVEKHRVDGSVRPGAEEGHEHFGFLDGISQPAIRGFTTNPVPGQTTIDAGRILLGETGDDTSRPSWARDGSFLAFRQLQQFVPEFNKFLTDNPIQESGLTREEGSALLGARMIGRWKSGAPVDLAPRFDDPVLGADPTRNNDFTYAHPGEDWQSNQTRCPFSAHIRKTKPRADFDPVNTVNHIVRAGIPYGPEVSNAEAQSNTTQTERGLAFMAYQSDIGNGFRFIQQTWANDPSFVFGKNATPGFDSIIGASQGQPRVVSGLDPTDATRDMTLLTDFVTSRGGEYFFSPPISAITDRLSQ